MMKTILGAITGLGLVLSSGAFAADAAAQQPVKTTQKKDVKSAKKVAKKAPKGRSTTTSVRPSSAAKTPAK